MSCCILMSETQEGLRNKFLKLKAMNVDLGKTMVMVSGGITKDGMSKSKVDRCGVCSLRVKANSVLCGMWIHSRCAGVKMMTYVFKKFHMQKNVKEILERQLNRK